MAKKSQLEIANEVTYKKVVEELELLKKLVTKKGFHQAWFNSLPKFKSREEAFHNLNEKYFEMIGDYRYSSYKAFQNVNRKTKRK